ncbi:MAG: hypothetical protein GX758_04660 [Tenericutes bacterium]|nr:hypothetical protein [Mycoplasmatota bacterium]
MKLKNKIITLILLIVLSIGCTEKNEIIKENINDFISEIDRINIEDNMSSTTKSGPYSLTSIIETLTPALTYNEINTSNKVTNDAVLVPKTSNEENDNNSSNMDNYLKDETAVNINLSNEILLSLEYSKEENTEPKKVLISNIKVKTNSKKGEIKFYGIIEGNNYTYIDLMRKNEIIDSLEINEDILGSKLIDGKMAIMFSTVLERVMNTSYENLNSISYLEIMSKSNITQEDLNFTITFDILIYTDDSVYALPLEFSNKVNIYDKNLSKQYTIKDKLYFVKIK